MSCIEDLFAKTYPSFECIYDDGIERIYEGDHVDVTFYFDVDGNTYHSVLVKDEAERDNYRIGFMTWSKLQSILNTISLRGGK